MGVVVEKFKELSKALKVVQEALQLDLYTKK